jgi:hypothetical protein
MQTPKPSRAPISRATLAFDEPRLIIERADGSVEQITGDRAITRWQRMRRRARTDADGHIRPGETADSDENE